MIKRVVVIEIEFAGKWEGIKEAALRQVREVALKEHLYWARGNVEVAAERLGVSVKTVRRWLRGEKWEGGEDEPYEAMKRIRARKLSKIARKLSDINCVRIQETPADPADYALWVDDVTRMDDQKGGEGVARGTKGERKRKKRRGET